jgi:peptidyl-prolyl cis-trans isomerase D
MAVLEKIRVKMGILVSIIIGVALLAFVLTDFLSGGRSIFAGRQQRVAEINGEVVNYKDFEIISQNISNAYKFQTRKATLDENENQQVHEQAWQQLIDKFVMGNEYEKIGLAVKDKELIDVMQGANPHPYVRYFFTNPETNQFDRASLLAFAKSLNTDRDPSKKAFWVNIENEIRKEQIMNKFNSLIRNGLYVTSFQAKSTAEINSKKVSLNYISEKLASISDSTIKLKNSDLKKYYEEHKAEYDQTQPVRTIEYIVYDITPSAADFEQAQKVINEIKPEFESETEIKSYINLNSDSSFKEKYFKPSQLTDTVRKFVVKAKKGDTYGPYFLNNAYYLVKLADVKDLPDSVKLDEIVLRPTANTEEAINALKKLADSLKTALSKGADFAQAVEKYSDSPSAKKGGDIGWIKEDTLGGFYNDLISANKGDVQVLAAQNALHVVKVVAKGKETKKYQVGILVKNLEPSSATSQEVYQQASKFVGNNNTSEKFDAALKKDNINPMRATLTTEMQNVNGIKNSRNLVRWAFTSDKGAISDIYQYDNKLVVAHLVEIRDKGILPLDINIVRENVMAAVMKEKKAEILKEKINKDLKGAGSIENLASKLSLTPQSAKDITFSSFILNDSYEPEVIAAATAIVPNKLSNAIEGKSGVYVIYVTSEENQEQANPEDLKIRMMGMYSNRINYLMPVMLKMSDIKDNRIKFY